jgi:glyoxylase I family protein
MARGVNFNSSFFAAKGVIVIGGVVSKFQHVIWYVFNNIGRDRTPCVIRRKKFGTADGASLDLQGTTVNLRVARADERMEGDASRSVYGYNHIGLEVEDIEAAFINLSARGYSFFMSPTDIPGLRIAFFRGPEDIVIELVQRIDAGS